MQYVKNIHRKMLPLKYVKNDPFQQRVLLKIFISESVFLYRLDSGITVNNFDKKLTVLQKFS